MKKLPIFLVLSAVVSWANADVKDYLPEPKLQEFSSQLKQGYIGFGITQRLLHANIEWVNPYGIAYAKLGAFLNNDNDFGAQLGFRYPYHFTSKDQNGYYVGAFAGHVERLSIDGEDKSRFGAGVDLSYVMLDAERISTLTLGVALAQKIKGQYGTEKEVEPKIQMAYSLSFDIF